MRKLIKLLLIAIGASLVVVVSLLTILQLPWTKEQMRSILFAAAQKQGVLLNIGAIDGKPPFKWTFQNVQMKIGSKESIEIEKLKIRIAILPLFRGEFSISFLHADKAVVRYAPSPSQRAVSLPSLSWPFSIKSLKVNELHVIDLLKKSKTVYAFQGKAKLRRKARGFVVEAKANSTDLSSEWKIEGSKKARYIDCEIKLDVRSQKALEPFYTLPHDASFAVSGRIHGPWKTWKSLFFPKPDKIYLKPLSANILGELRTLEIPELQGRELNALTESSFFLFANRSIDIQLFALKSPLLCLKGKGKVDAAFKPTSFSLSFLLPHLSHFSPYLGGIVSGEAFLDTQKLSLSLSSGRFDVRGVEYQKVRAAYTAELTGGIWTGPLFLEADHPLLPLQLRGLLAFHPRRELLLDNIEVEMPSSIASGYLKTDLSTFESTGSVVAQFFDLARFSPLDPEANLGGRVGLTLHFQGADLRFFARAQNLQFRQLLSKELSAEGIVADWINDPKATLSLEAETAYFGAFFFEAVKASSRWEKNQWPYSLSARGKWKEFFEVTSSGWWKWSQDQFDANVDVFKGQILQKPFAIQKPFSVRYTPSEFLLTECLMKLSHGYLLAALNLRPDFAKIHLKGEHFPIDFFALATSRFTLEGNSSLDVSVEGSAENLRGRINLLLEGADILQAGKKIPIQSKGSFQVNLDGSIAQIHGQLIASSQQFFDLTASLPLAYQIYPLKIGIEKKRPLNAELTMEGNMEDLFDFINIGSQHAAGLLSCHLLLSKNLAEPLLQGTLEWRQGSYENYFTGMVCRDIEAHASAEGKLIRLHALRGSDENNGKLSGTGTIELKDNLPFSFDAVADNLKTFDLEWIAVSLSGPVRISGDTYSTLAKGEVTVSRADISIPKQLPLDLPILPITFINEPTYLKHAIHSPKPAYPFHYDGLFHAPKTIFLSGRGLDCELEGDLHIIGKNLAIDATGNLRLVKGKFAFAGKQFTLTQGEVTFAKEPRPSGYLNLSGTLALSDLTVTAMLRGPFDAPQLTFQSTPMLPTSSILARILFNKDVTELSATQALQLAETIVTLSGDSGTNVLETIRQSLGIDRLNISSSGDSDRVSVQIGKYLTQGVMITLSQSTESSQVIVEVELKGGFLLQAETQEDDQAKFSLKWNMNY